MSNNNFDPAQEKHEAHEKLIDRFDSVEAYFEFVLKRQEEQIKQGVKYIDFSFHWDPVGALEPIAEGFTPKSV